MATKTKTLTLIAALSAANVAFRFALAGGPPNLKPIAFFVIIAGIIGGPVSGFAVGWLSMTVSDLAAFGAGIWTIETSGGMAIVGLLAGLIWHRVVLPSRWKMVLGGFLLTVMYDVGTSVVDAFLFSYPAWPAVLGLYVPFLAGSVSPYPFGLVHELTTAILLGTIGPALVSQIRKVYR
jgi:hypothetical protein